MRKQVEFFLKAVVFSFSLLQFATSLYAAECVDLDGDCINEPPVCQLNTDRYDLTCEEETQKVLLDGSQAYDPDGDPLTFLWQESGAVLPAAYRYNFNNQPATGFLFLSYGAGPSYLPLDFTMTLQVSDGVNPPVTCALAITVEQCPVDCEGTFNGTKQFDSCGVCDGDGTGCICERQNLVPQALELDGTNKLLSVTFNQLVNLASKQQVISKKKALSLKKSSNDSYLRSWQLSWALPTESVQCGSLIECFDVATTSNSTEIQTLAGGIVLQAAKVSKLLKTTASGKKAAKLYLKLEKLQLDIESILSQRPASIGVCSSGA